jgi:hypothetical protein
MSGLTPATITAQIGLVCLIFILLAVSLVGRGDLEEEQRAGAEYCEHVAAGRWPAYRPEINCGINTND